MSYSVRPYGAKIGDYQTVSGWYAARGGGMLQETVLPPDGVVLERDGEPVAASWLYASYGIGVAFWEGFVTRPGLSLKEARDCCQHSVGAVLEIARARHCGLVKAYVRAPVFRHALHFGFVVDLPVSAAQAMEMTGWIPVILQVP